MAQAEDDDEEYTPAQKAKIARHFIYVAPHGEVHELVADLQKVVRSKDNIITDQWLKESMTEYNKRRFEIVSGSTSKVICCPQGEVEPNKYLNPSKKIVCEIDPVKQKIIKESDASNVLKADNELKSYRNELETKLKEYLDNYYEDGTSPNSVAKGMGSVYISQNGQVAIVISFKNLNQGNYWTGGWQSEWTFSVSKQEKVKIEGRIRLNVHYFEDGNVQLNSTFNENGEVEIGNAKETAERAINTILTLENDFQKRLTHFYVQMHESTFKNMRRFLPKIGKKMDWRASVHALIAESAAK